MPLAWAHAEFLKLLIARAQGKPVELLDSVRDRYGKGTPPARYTRWRDETPVHALAAGRTLLVEDRRPFTLRYGWDGWQSVAERESEPQPFGLWSVAVGPDRYDGRTTFNFTRRFGDDWEDKDHAVALSVSVSRRLEQAKASAADAAE